MSFTTRALDEQHADNAVFQRLVLQLISKKAPGLTERAVSVSYRLMLHI